MAKIVDVNFPKPKEVSKMSQDEKKKPTLAEQLEEVQEKAILGKAASNILNAGTSSEGESLATSIVTKSMETQSELLKQMREDASGLKKEVKEANQAASNMQWELLQKTLEDIKEAQRKADESAKAAAAAGAPKDAFGYYNQVKEELSKLVQSLPQKEPAPQNAGGMSDATQIRLKELELEQLRILEEIRQENQRANQEFQLKLAEFSDNKELRKMEYEDKRRFRQEGLQGLTDFATAIGASISAERGVPAETSEEVARPSRVKTGKEETAYIGAFDCAECGKEVLVTAGQNIATCPGCGAKYTVDRG